MANYLQELAQDAVCESHTSHMTGLWFLLTRPLRLNINEWMNYPSIHPTPTHPLTYPSIITNCIGHILRRNCLLQQVTEGKIKGQIEVTRTRGKRRKKLLDDLKDRRGYCQLKEETLDRTMWRIRFGRAFGPVVWQITDDDDDDDDGDDDYIVLGWRKG